MNRYRKLILVAISIKRNVHIIQLSRLLAYATPANGPEEASHKQIAIDRSGDIWLSHYCPGNAP